MWVMWQSATPAIVGFASVQHLFVGELGGVIAVVGGIISIITLRATRRAARPAVIPRAAEPDPPSSTRPVYAEPAPPTSPARRLHPGPISLSAPTTPNGADDERPHVSTSLFDPDLHISAPTEPEAETLAELGGAPPILRTSSHFSAAWRAQATPIQETDPTHTPIWHRSPFLQTGSAARLALDGASTSSTSDLLSAPPIWRSAGTSALFGLASPTDAQASAQAAPGATSETPATFTASAPIWSSWAHPRATDSLRAAERDVAALSEDNPTSTQPEPPIWSSRLLKPE